jgi:hypothetical protein
VILWTGASAASSWHSLRFATAALRTSPQPCSIACSRSSALLRARRRPRRLRPQVQGQWEQAGSGRSGLCSSQNVLTGYEPLLQPLTQSSLTVPLRELGLTDFRISARSPASCRPLPLTERRQAGTLTPLSSPLRSPGGKSAPASDRSPASLRINASQFSISESRRKVGARVLQPLT